MDWPLVSCVMPTADRRKYVPQAIRYFQRQDYPNRELVILDDGRDCVADLIPDDPLIRFVRLNGKRTLGAKRNECVEHSRGDLILHWDDDDWMAANRITCQVEALLREDAEVCGLTQMLFFAPASNAVWLYTYPAGAKPWLAGGSLLYTRDFWRRSPFPHVQVASDTRFIWNHRLDRAARLTDPTIYVALIHPGNTSPKLRGNRYWSRWGGSIDELLREDKNFYTGPEHAQVVAPTPPTYAILMVVHNGLDIARLAILRTLQHSRGQDARLIVVDSGSQDGIERWLELLAKRGDIDLVKGAGNIGHGPGLQLGLQRANSPYIVTLDSDAFPLSAEWLPRLRQRLTGRVKVTGVLHHRDYIHPSCLMVERETLESFGLTFLNEKDRPSRFDVAERISHAVKGRGYEIAGLARTGSLRRGSVSEPVYLGSEYEGLVYHQWYTTRAVISQGGQVDDVPREAIDRSLQELLAAGHAEPREVTVVLGVRAGPRQQDRIRNALACLRALNSQDLERWRYRITIVEQDDSPRLRDTLAPFADRYLFVRNSGPYNRGWAFNVAAAAEPAGTPVLCLMDADLLPPADFLRRGLGWFHRGSRAILPYTEVLYLDGASTEKAIAGSDANLRGRRFTTSQGGCFWISAPLYREIGGHDERFRGWGSEDREFYDRVAKSCKIDRWLGRLLHLDHTRVDENSSQAWENHRLYQRLSREKTTVGPVAAPERPRATGWTHRDWENWHRWDRRRIDRIVVEEKKAEPATSPRWRLARIAAAFGGRILDAGCGAGALLTHLRGDAARQWTGVDITRAMLDSARRTFPTASLMHADAAALPLASASFDVVVMRHVLEHVDREVMEAALREMFRTASRAVILSFHIPPSRAARVATSRRVGENFLETQWLAADIEGPAHAAGWVVRERFNIAASAAAPEEIWILEPEAVSPVEPPNQQGPKISIVMPTFRRPHTISRTVRSIQAQTYAHWELIIVDNSGDGDYWFRDPRIQVCSDNSRRSASYARNCGLRCVSGDLVCFFDDDDEMFPGYLETFVTAFTKDPNAKLVRCGMIVSDGRTNYSYATPECCLRREYATPTWTNRGSRQDQLYFSTIVLKNGWSEEAGDIVVIREAQCRANTDSHGGLRAGSY